MPLIITLSTGVCLLSLIITLQQKSVYYLWLFYCLWLLRFSWRFIYYLWLLRYK
jgi:hypothetical protein